ncbi:MAG: alanine--tRNA ligase [Anaerohalosphaeraceae bacterium]|nr:alanine--tRNA ligase [Anaerohalosphaeraceae bacterium]
MLSSNEIRSSFIKFFEGKGHSPVPSSPVVPIGDDTLLFANAGMNQFKDVFLGTGTRPYKRAANSQKCIRAGGKHNDLEDVGLDTYHHTFFEMLGNWSLGDYFKAEAIEWAWELLTKVWGIDESKLYATVFAGDENDGLEFDSEAADLWTKVTSIPKERVLAFGKKDNFWEMGNSGPCGPCSEIHIDLGADRCDKKHDPSHKCEVNAGCARFIEIWNLVFIQYNRQGDGKIVPLPAKHVDTGMGLERVAAVMQNKESNYDTDLFTPITEAIGKLCGKKYTSKLDNKNDIAFRVIADHLRTLTFAITDGGTPGNEGRGYVLRRILRRAARFARVLNMREPFLYKLVDTVVDCMSEAFGELTDRVELVKTVIKSEEESFGRTLDRGLEIFKTAATKAEKDNAKTISGEQAFELYDTYGFPLDLTELMAKERNLKIDVNVFDELMAAQRQRARAAQKSGSLAAFVTEAALPMTEDSHKYKTHSCETKIIGWVDSKGFQTDGTIAIQNGDVAVILKETCFYAESGGQVGDCGRIEGPDGRFIVETTEKIADCVIHRGKIEKGTLSIGQAVKAIVDINRLASMKNHTATHLLQWALQKVMGEAVKQQGSLVCPEYLRFDFTSPKALTREQISEVEKLVNEKINEAIPINNIVMPLDQAKQVGAMALFGEKYGEFVRIVSIGGEGEAALEGAFSKEFCGGIHIDNTAGIGAFKITKEESVSAGIRRITALTAGGLIDYLSARSDVVDQLCRLLKTPAEQIAERVTKLLDDNKKLAKQIKSGTAQGGGDCMAKAKQLLESAEKVGDATIVVSKIDGGLEPLRAAIDMIKKKASPAAVVLASESNGKVILLAGVTDDLIKKGLKAGDIVKEIAPVVGGGGGGRAQMAQAGGKNPEKIDEAIAKAKEFITVKLG